MIIRYIISFISVCLLILNGLDAQLYVEAQGDQFRYLDNEYKFIGVNISNLSHTDYDDADARIREQLCAAKNMGASVVRLFVPTDTDQLENKIYNRLKRVLDIAAEDQFGSIKFILCLTDGFSGKGRSALKDSQNKCYSDVEKPRIKYKWFKNGNQKNGWDFNDGKNNYGHVATGSDVYPNVCTSNCTCASGYMSGYIPMLDYLASRLNTNNLIFAWELGNELLIHDPESGTLDHDELLEFIYFAGNRLKIHHNVRQMVTTGFESIFKAFGETNLASKIPITNDATLITQYNNSIDVLDKVYKAYNNYISPMDFVVNHVYAKSDLTAWDHIDPNNGLSGGQGVTLDVAWAISNNKPWVIEEGLFELADDTDLCTNGYPGATWRFFNGLPASVPAPASSYNEVDIPDACYRRCDAMEVALDQLLEIMGGNGYMNWGFYALDIEFSDHGKDSEVGMTKDVDDWATMFTKLFNARRKLFDDTWLECSDDEMIITNWPGTNTKLLHCVSEDYIEASSDLKNEEVTIAASDYVQITNLSTNGNRLRATACEQVCRGCSGFNRRIAVEAPIGEIDLGPERTGLDSYPNPFNHSISFEFSLNEDAHTNLSVFNSMGQMVSLIHDGKHEAGKHIFKYDGTDLVPGIYFCQLIVGNDRFIKQINKTGL